MGKKKSKQEKISLFKPEEIEKMRLASGLTQSELADKYGINVRTFNQWASGRGKPSAKNIPILLKLREDTLGIVQNINGTNAQGTQIIGDGQTTNNSQPCGDEQTETSKLLDAHNSLIEQMRQLTAVVASQQETISRLVANNQ